MARKEQGAGFQQAAGLIRYFDAEEETSVHIDPRIVLGSGIALAVIVSLLNYLYPIA